MSRTFKSDGCSHRQFREMREMQDRLAEHMTERRRLWFMVNPDDLPEWACCYVIYFAGVLSYVGMTENLKKRFQSHRAKAFRKVLSAGNVRVSIKVKIPRKFGEWAMTEVRLIKRLQPPLNRKGVASKEDSF